MNKRASVGLFYGSSTCYTEMTAEKIQRYFGDQQIDLFNIADHSVEEMAHYQHLLMGIPTWDYGELQEDWEDQWDALDDIDFNGKTVAIFGLGDQVGYPDWFLDAMGYLHNKLLISGAKIVGYWPNEGYTYNSSQALTADETQFVGLALDDENQFELSEARIASWCEQIRPDLNL